MGSVFGDIGEILFPSLGFETWNEISIINLVTEIIKISTRPLILIDGIAGSGKTTLAISLGDILKADIVSTDDVCWCADIINWDEEMLKGIIYPWLEVKYVSYKPSGWIKENRQGFIEVDAKKPLIIEGMGACRKEMREVASYSIWIDTESDIARSRLISRDLPAGVNGETIESIIKFADWWDSMMHPFLIKEEPWKYTNIIINGFLSDSNKLYIIKNFD